jgi:hypothetical protein
MSADRLAELVAGPRERSEPDPEPGPSILDEARRQKRARKQELYRLSPAGQPATSRPVRRFASSGFDGGARPAVARPAEPEKNRAEVILGLARLRALNTVRRPA